MQRLMIIDCENVLSKEMADSLMKLKDWHIIFILGKNQKITIPKDNVGNYEIIQCNKTGRNQLDFILVTELTCRVLRKEFLQYYILANDKGYDIVIDFLKEKINTQVFRVTPDKVINKFVKSDERETIDTGSETKSRIKTLESLGIKSGIRLDRFNNKMQCLFGSETNKIVSKLKSSDVITVKSNKRTKVKQVYFSKSKLQAYIKNTNIFS